MAHLFMLPPPIPLRTTFHGSDNARRRSSVTPSQSQDEDLIDLSEPPRTDSMSSTGSASPTHRNSALAAHRNPQIFNSSQTIRTRSIGGVPGAIVFERSPVLAPTDDDIIIVTVRLTNTFRKSSVSSDWEAPLPSRPPRRGFLRRMTTRVNSGWDHSAEKEERYKAVKMPRGEYKRYFARDREGRYAGTEEEREWSEVELMGRYGGYQEMPLYSVAC